MKKLLIILLFGIIACNKTETNVEEGVYYTCSMDPQVIESQPGNCPICKMPLTKMEKGKTLPQGEIQLSEQQIQLGNIQWDTVGTGTLGDELVFTATLATDLTRTNTVSARITGRIDRLYFKTVGDYVRKGSKIIDLYSEELNNAKREYLLALEKQRTLRSDVVDFEQIVQSARQKLTLWGLTESQIDEIARSGNVSDHTTFYSPYNGFITNVLQQEGGYVMEGGSILQLADLSSLWAEVQVPASQLSLVAVNQPVTLQFPDYPDLALSAKVAFVNPEISTGSRLNLVRVNVPNAGNKLRPGMPAQMVVRSQQREALTLPTDAVLRSEGHASVWLYVGNNTFKNVMVETGMETSNNVEIKSGIHQGDVVVTSGAYLLQSEYIFKRGTDPMAGHEH
ncbi:MAG: efflux RND transporter periplasmic adaptor subunit [Saprospiraceae bacterium]